MGRTSGIRAYDLRAEAGVARVDDSADSMKPLLSEECGEEGKGPRSQKE